MAGLVVRGFAVEAMAEGLMALHEAHCVAPRGRSYMRHNRTFGSGRLHSVR